MDFTKLVDTTSPEIVRLETSCPHNQRRCELREGPARNHAACAIASLQLDIAMKMRHATDVHGLSRKDAVAFVIGCYITANAGTFDTDGLRALGVLVGELASNA